MLRNLSGKKRANPFSILNEVLSLNAQESDLRHADLRDANHSSMKS